MKQRRELRLREYDYSQNGAYFVTICTQNREKLFTDTSNFTAVGADRCVRPFSAEIAEFWLLEIAKHFDNVFIDKYVVMPDHIHFILRIDAPLSEGGHIGPPLQQMVQWYKTMSTNAYIKAVKDGLLPPFSKRIWQRGYYEHVIRSYDDFLDCWTYIENNPLKQLSPTKDEHI